MVVESKTMAVLTADVEGRMYQRRIDGAPQEVVPRKG